MERGPYERKLHHKIYHLKITNYIFKSYGPQAHNQQVLIQADMVINKDKDKDNEEVCNRHPRKGTIRHLNFVGW